VATSVVVFTLLYALLAVVEVKLILRYMKEVPPARDESEAIPDREPAFSY